MLLRLGAAVAAVCAIVAAGCGRDDAERSGTTAGHRQGPPAVRFTGAEVPGTLYIAAGPDDFNADLYRVRGSVADAVRLTFGGRISSVSASPTGVVTSNARGSGSDRAEVLRVDGQRARPGRVIDPNGQSPSLSRAGQVAWSVVNYRADGTPVGTSIFVEPLRGGKRRLVRRSARALTAEWEPGDRLVVLSQPDIERSDHARLLLDEGDGRFRTVRLSMPVRGMLVGPDGTIMTGAGERLDFLTADGERIRTLRTAWDPIAWAPDGRSMLVTRGSRLGLLSPRNGQVRVLGRVAGGTVLTASWVE